MLDHVFTDAIGALRDTFEKAFLERQAFEDGDRRGEPVGSGSYDHDIGHDLSLGCS